MFWKSDPIWLYIFSTAAGGGALKTSALASVSTSTISEPVVESVIFCVFMIEIFEAKDPFVLSKYCAIKFLSVVSQLSVTVEPLAQGLVLKTNLNKLLVCPFAVEFICSELISFKSLKTFWTASS